MADQPLRTKGKGMVLPVIYLIVFWKLAKGTLLILASLSIFFLEGRDLGGVLNHVLRWIHLDPEREFFVNIGQWLDQITPASFREWEAGTFLYGVLMLIVGLGFALRARWAIWLAIGEYAFFIPIEICKLLAARTDGHAGHASGTLFGIPHFDMWVILAANTALVIYLLKNRDNIFRPRR